MNSLHRNNELVVKLIENDTNEYDMKDKILELTQVDKKPRDYIEEVIIILEKNEILNKLRKQLQLTH